MKKSFRALLIEREKEYVYRIKSIANIHDTELMGRIGQSMEEFQLIELARDGFKPMSASNTEFPNHPNRACYILKATLGKEPRTTTLLQLVALWSNISDRNIKVDKDGGEEAVFAKQHEEIPDAQADVGERRIGKLFSELEVLHKQRMEKTIERPVYESYCISHRTLTATVGREVHRGFYLVEGHDDSCTITGPFKKAPINYEFVESLPKAQRVLSETVENNYRVMEVEMPANWFQPKQENTANNNAMQKWTVEVLNSDTGQQYPVVVTAGSDIEARNRAVEIVSQKMKIDPSSLLATDPESK